MEIKKFSEFMVETKEFKVDDMVNFHNDLKQMKSGKIVKIKKDGKDIIYTIELNGVKFTRKASEVYEF